jgi:glycosyltransferase involved in cell wall biosynthesis
MKSKRKVVPLVSVVIPCYNHGEYIEDAVESVLGQTYKNFEIIVVNDGSTDKETNLTLKNLGEPKTKVLHTLNQGLPSARNNGIKVARGKYILPLDADNKIAPEFLEIAVKELESDKNIGIVYSYAGLFGARNGIMILPKYSKNRFLRRNLIDACAFFRRSDWEATGGYKPNMVDGWEDWELWLSIIELGRSVKFIPKILFYYRVVPGSLSSGMNRQMRVDMFLRLIQNHPKLYLEKIKPLVRLYYFITWNPAYNGLNKIYRKVKFLFIRNSIKFDK